MRPLAEPAKAGPRGGCTCHNTCREPDLPPRDQRPLPQCIFAEKVAQSTALWAQQRGEAIRDILSSLRSHLHRWGYTAMPKEDAQGAAVATPLSAHHWESQSRSRRREDQHDEALPEAREAHQ